MTVNATAMYVRGLLAGLPVPGIAGPLTAYVAPPAVQDDAAGPPVVYIWPSEGSEDRQAIPRGTPPAAGWKTTHHTLDLWLQWFGDLTSPTADTAFTAVLDAVLQVLRSAPDPAPVTDPYTAEPSILVDVGERMSWTTGVVHALADQRWVRFDAQIRVPITEMYQA